MNRMFRWRKTRLLKVFVFAVFMFAAATRLTLTISPSPLPRLTVDGKIYHRIALPLGHPFLETDTGEIYHLMGLKAPALNALPPQTRVRIIGKVERIPSNARFSFYKTPGENHLYIDSFIVLP